MNQEFALLAMFAYNSINCLTVLEKFAEVFSNTGLGGMKFVLMGRPKGRTLTEIVDHLRINSDGDQSYHIESKDETIFISIGGQGASGIQIDLFFSEFSLSRIFDDLAKVLSKHDGFINFRICSIDYDNRQWIDSVWDYTYHKLDYSHLPTWTDQRGELRIDVSNNPGRRYQYRGYKEAIGSIMYIGNRFCSLTGADMSAIKAADWLKIKEIHNDVIRIDAWPTPFDSAEGEQAVAQEKLRALLFPKAKRYKDSSRSYGWDLYLYRVDSDGKPIKNGITLQEWIEAIKSTPGLQITDEHVEKYKGFRYTAELMQKDIDLWFPTFLWQDGFIQIEGTHIDEIFPLKEKIFALKAKLHAVVIDYEGHILSEKEIEEFWP
jgi:hypothetical protein